jgi:hypothetical protein
MIDGMGEGKRDENCQNQQNEIGLWSKREVTSHPALQLRTRHMGGIPQHRLPQKMKSFNRIQISIGRGNVDIIP